MHHNNEFLLVTNQPHLAIAFQRIIVYILTKYLVGIIDTESPCR